MKLFVIILLLVFTLICIRLLQFFNRAGAFRENFVEQIEVVKSVTNDKEKNGAPPVKDGAINYIFMDKKETKVAKEQKEQKEQKKQTIEINAEPKPIVINITIENKMPAA